MLQTVMNGRPRRRDVETLATHFRTMKEGDIVQHATLAGLINEQPGSNRYRSVIDKAKQVFCEAGGVMMVCEHRVGYRYPTGQEQLKHANGKIRSGTKAIVKGAKVCADVTDARLPDERDRKARDHVVQRIRYVAELARVERRQLAAAVNKTDPPPPMKV